MTFEQMATREATREALASILVFGLIVFGVWLTFNLPRFL